MRFSKGPVWGILILLIVIGKVQAEGKSNIVSLSGNYGFYSEGYHMDGRDARRPGTTGRLYFTPIVSFYGLTFGLKMDYFLTTEQRFVTQPINRISIAPSWGWGSANVWNFSPRFSDFSLSGVTLQGAGLHLHPGKFTLSLVGGRSQKACEDSLKQSFQRNLYGLQVGFGGFKVNILKAKDDLHSIEEPGSAAALPQENLVVNTCANFTLFKVKFSGEIAASAYTRDLRSDKVDTTDIPELAKKLYPIRYSTRADYAWKTRMGVPIPTGSITGSYLYVGPGYTSLGLTTNHNDRIEYQISGRSRPSRFFSLSCSFRGRRDNLIGEKIGTTKNHNFSLATQIVPSSTFNISINYLLNQNKKDVPSDTSKTQWIDNKVQAVTVSPTFILDVTGWRHTIRPVFSYQNNSDDIRQTTSEMKGVNLSYSNQITSSLSTSASFSWTKNDMGEVALTVTSYGGGAVYRVFEGKIPISLNFSYAPSSRGNTMRTRLGGSYRVSKAGSVKLGIQMMTFSGKSASYSDYNELTANLSYSSRFSI